MCPTARQRDAILNRFRSFDALAIIFIFYIFYVKSGCEEQ
jgi:hypothetical protein